MNFNHFDFHFLSMNKTDIIMLLLHSSIRVLDLSSIKFTHVLQIIKPTMDLVRGVTNYRVKFTNVFNSRPAKGRPKPKIYVYCLSVYSAEVLRELHHDWTLTSRNLLLAEVLRELHHVWTLKLRDY